MKTGYTKSIVKPGDGVTKPMPGQKVRMQYTGKLTTGKVFDTSVGKKPFEFNVGVGQVIRAWDEGVLTMTVGEEAILTASPAYAYGASGYPPVIPPNSTLIFEVKLLAILS